MKTDQVLDEYQKGDEDARMSLFLYHRGLRDAFTRIDRDAPLKHQAEQGPCRRFRVRLRERFDRTASRASPDRIER